MFPSAVKEIADVTSYIARLLTVDVTHSIFTARKRSLEQGNVFTGVSVCQSTGGGGAGVCIQRGSSYGGGGLHRRGWFMYSCSLHLGGGGGGCLPGTSRKAGSMHPAGMLSQKRVPTPVGRGH